VERKPLMQTAPLPLLRSCNPKWLDGAMQKLIQHAPHPVFAWLREPFFSEIQILISMRTTLLISTYLLSIGLSTVCNLSAQQLGGAGAPGWSDSQFKNFQIFPDYYEYTRPQFIGTTDIRTAVVQPDGKIIIGGSFRIRKPRVQFDVTRIIDAEWKNLARLNSDGTLDISFISKSAVDLAKAGYYDGKVLEWGPDRAVYSILVEQVGDSYQYMVAGDFLNFSHSSASISVPRLRYLVLNALTPNPLAKNPEPLLELSAEIAGGSGFDSPVRKMRKVSGNGLVAQVIVSDGNERLALDETVAPIGTIVLESSSGLYYRRVAIDSDPIADDWLLLNDSFEASYFFMGDFQNILVNDPQPYIVNITRDGTQLTVPDTWIVAPNPNGRVNDVAVSADQNIFVGEFTTLAGALNNRIGSVLDDGSPNPAFSSGTGFNANAYAIDLDPVRNTLVAVGAFTSYNGTAKGRIVRLDLSGNIDPTYPAANGVNGDGANGVIQALCRQPDGRLIIAGSFTTYNGIPRSGIARIERDGSLDLTFTPRGIASGIHAFATDIDGGPGTASLFARPVVVGNFSNLYGNTGFKGVGRILGGSWPTIWYQPNEIDGPHTVEAGGSITLNVVATDNFVGYPGSAVPVPISSYQVPQAPSEPLFYQWRRNGANIAGANQSSLSLPSVTYRQAGIYTVKIYNSQYSVISHGVQLDVLNPFLYIIPLSGLRVEGAIGSNPSLNAGLGGKIKFTVNRQGTASGTFTMSGSNGRLTSYKFVGQFDYDGTSIGRLVVNIPRKNMSPLTLRLQMDIAVPNTFDFTDNLTHNSISDGVDTAEINAWNTPWSKSNPAADAAGNYNVGLDIDPLDISDVVFSQPKTPQGHGCLTLSIPATTGVARIVGALPDGTKFTSASTLWGDANATLPLWVPLYKNAGVLQGTLAIDTSISGNPVSADLRWTKPGNLKRLPGLVTFSDVVMGASPGSGIYDASAFSASLPLSPSNFNLNFDDGIWTPGNGGLTAAFSQPFTVSGRATTRVTPNLQSVSMKLTTSTGLATGSFVDADFYGKARKAIFWGIILTQGGSPIFRGSFVMPNTASAPAYYIGGSVTGY